MEINYNGFTIRNGDLIAIETENHTVYGVLLKFLDDSKHYLFTIIYNSIFGCSDEYTKNTHEHRILYYTISADVKKDPLNEKWFVEFDYESRVTNIRQLTEKERVIYKKQLDYIKLGELIDYAKKTGL